MIRNESEYQKATERLDIEKRILKARLKQLGEMNLSTAEIKRAMDPCRSFHEQLREEILSYEKMRRGEFDEVRNFDGMGRLLVALRIASRLSQRELAERLDIHESAISRYERNEYFGITIERASKIVEAIGVTLSTTVEELLEKSA